MDKRTETQRAHIISMNAILINAGVVLARASDDIQALPVMLFMIRATRHQKVKIATINIVVERNH